ncbi:Pentatricopeptide repeat [Dillenia turbinata]|uniref:Pentatricopeptide repeat n=1 Tax=Dillenia turbinata TaxID=194707 RepID=A0AAN8W2V5_9MAGN
MEGRGFVVDLVTITSLLIELHSVLCDSTERVLKHIRAGALMPSVLKRKADMDASMKNQPNRSKDFTPLFPSKRSLVELINSMGRMLVYGQRGQGVQGKGSDSFDIDMKGYFNEMWDALHEMGEKLCPADIATYNLIIQGLRKMGRADLASIVLDKLMSQGGYLDIVMYNTLINALGKAGQIDDLNNLSEQMRCRLETILEFSYAKFYVVYNSSNVVLNSVKGLTALIGLFRPLPPPNHSPLPPLLKWRSLEVEETGTFMERLELNGQQPEVVDMREAVSRQANQTTITIENLQNGE